MKMFLLGAFLFAFASCGKDSQIWPTRKEKVFYVTPAESERYSYVFKDGGCSTGEHSYDTLVEVCEALKNSDLNNQCASDKREDLFAKSCQGNFI